MSRGLAATQRANILFAREQGFSYKKVADQVDCAKSTVRDLFRRLEVPGTTSTRKRSDRLRIEACIAAKGGPNKY